MVPGDPSGWHILSAVLQFLRRAYLFKLNQPKTARDNLWSGTHTHTHHSQISWLAAGREDTPGEPSGMCSCRRILTGLWGNRALLWTGCFLIRVQGKCRDEGLSDDQGVWLLVSSLLGGFSKARLEHN